MTELDVEGVPLRHESWAVSEEAADVERGRLRDNRCLSLANLSLHKFSIMHCTLLVFNEHEVCCIFTLHPWAGQ